MIAADRLIGGLPISVSVADDRCLVYAHAGTVPRTPASNEKLLLSMALLDRFGPTYRIPTTVEGPPPTNGSVKGNLWLAGHGDPELTTRRSNASPERCMLSASAPSAGR